MHYQCDWLQKLRLAYIYISLFCQIIQQKNINSPYNIVVELVRAPWSSWSQRRGRVGNCLGSSWSVVELTWYQSRHPKQSQLSHRSHWSNLSSLSTNISLHSLQVRASCASFLVSFFLCFAFLVAVLDGVCVLGFALACDMVVTTLYSVNAFS